MLEETGEKKEDHKTFYTIDSGDLIPNIYGVVEQQNKILRQFETNPVRKYHEMLEENDEKKEAHKKFFNVNSEDLTQNISEMVENKISYQNETNIVMKYLEILEDSDEIVELTMSNTSRYEEEQLGLKECIDRKKKDLNDIHYITDERTVSTA